LLAAADLAAAGLGYDLRCSQDVDVKAITFDSQAVASGTMYCCVPGQRFDGHDFAPAAVAAGATALLVRRPLDLPVAQVVVEDVRAAVGPLADALYGHPSRAVTVIGVTGTNGKTTTTHLLEAIYRAAGRPAASIGTLSGTRTTPEAPVLQATLARLRDEGREVVAMEVSSHALVQHRVDAVAFAAAVFTNLTQDHLDYHATMEDYFAAKRRLFESGRAAVAVVNVDDPWGRRLRNELQARRQETGEAAPVPFSLDDLDELVIGADGSRFRWRGHEVALRLGGRFNVRNALAAATTAATLGVDGPSIVAGLEAVDSVRGRFEPVKAGQPFTVLVDYAHTPDGLEQALASARELTGSGGRVIVVFGAGGDRDRGKRPLMGAAASRYADYAVVTSDNPRSEDPQRIIEEVVAGANSNAELEVEVDRARAIEGALRVAQPGDVVVIAGKGHERVQEMAGRVVAFDDAEVARQALLRLQAAGGGW
jgi:UDP-N-acetylmuramoyl-L-alanyl-D-glutamate--2,6-diaminopimelate ligase